MLLVADDHLEGVQLPGSRQLMLQDGQGFSDVGQMAVDQELLYLGVRVLVVLTGFAEVEVEHPAVTNCILAAMSKLEANVSYQKIVIAAPIPRPGASVTQLKNLFSMTKAIQVLCKSKDRFEFSKTGHLFYGPGGLYANLFVEDKLSHAGKILLANQLLDKLNSLGFAKAR